MNSNNKGMIGLTKVLNDLYNKGYECYLPVSDYSPIDIIVANENYEIRKLQVKYRKSNNGLITVLFSSVVNRKKVPINLSYIDGWAIYNPDINSIIYLDKRILSNDYKSISFRISEPKQKQPNVSPSYKDFIDEKIFWY